MSQCLRVMELQTQLLYAILGNYFTYAAYYIQFLKYVLYFKEKLSLAILKLTKTHF